jgi:hypothetical protein
MQVTQTPEQVAAFKSDRALSPRASLVSNVL